MKAIGYDQLTPEKAEALTKAAQGQEESDSDECEDCGTLSACAVCGCCVVCYPDSGCPDCNPSLAGLKLEQPDL